MNVSALSANPSTTLVILLGASAWPNSPGLQASKAFVNAAQGFRNYILDPQGFGLPPDNLFDQFDSTAGISDQLELLSSFLEQQAQAQKAANLMVNDVLVYFVGHGGFAGSSGDFYLLTRRANANSLRASGMSIEALAEVLREKSRPTRRYLLLDCCFAAAAFYSFQGGPDQAAILKTVDAFYVRGKSGGFPKKGTALLCSSDHKTPSQLLPDESCTMFSYALLDVLRSGDPHRPSQLSLRDIRELAQDRLAALPDGNAPRPGLHSPDQSEGDVADVPLFPNFSAELSQNRVERWRREGINLGGGFHPMAVRKEEILRALVEEHIRSSIPVASETLVRKYKLRYGSSTVRGELRGLEEAGLIYQPHTSAGRVPTDLGYRYFIEELMQESGLSLDEQRLLKHRLSQKQDETTS